jgi:hypothetical protein
VVEILPAGRGAVARDAGLQEEAGEKKQIRGRRRPADEDEATTRGLRKRRPATCLQEVQGQRATRGQTQRRGAARG